MDTLQAITSAHVFTGYDGVTVTTTWHNTRKEAQARAGVGGLVLGGGILGKFRAITYSKAV